MSFDDMELPEEEVGGTEDRDASEGEMTVESKPGKFDKLLGENSRRFKLSGMFKD